MTSPLKIAVGYDGSSESEMAIRWALYIAIATNAQVTVVHATGLLEHAHVRFLPTWHPMHSSPSREGADSMRIICAGSSTTATRARYFCVPKVHQSARTC